MPDAVQRVGELVPVKRWVNTCPRTYQVTDIPMAATRGKFPIGCAFIDEVAHHVPAIFLKGNGNQRLAVGCLETWLLLKWLCHTTSPLLLLYHATQVPEKSASR